MAFGRLADLGYVDFYEALDLFRPLLADQVAIGEDSQERSVLDDEPTRLPLAIAEEVDRPQLPRARDRPRSSIPSRPSGSRRALMVLVNKVLAAGRAKPGQSEVVRRGALYATSTLSLGLETVARGDLGKATAGVADHRARPGCSGSATPSRTSSRGSRTALAPRSLTAGSPARELVAALCSPRPLFARRGR